jgi:hypothetical protein
MDNNLSCAHDIGEHDCLTSDKKIKEVIPSKASAVNSGEQLQGNRCHRNASEDPPDDIDLRRARFIMVNICIEGGHS